MRKSRYDDEVFFEKYGQMARSRLGLSGAGEWETLEPLLPDFAGKRVLDLGCGYGWHCIYAAEHGAAAVTGVDLSEKMLAVAREKTKLPQVTYVRGDMAETAFPPESFDVVLSSLAIHYLPSFTDFLNRVRQCLVPGGDFVFSVEHPIFTAAGPQDWYYGPDGTPLHFPVDRYFEEGRRTASSLPSAGAPIALSFSTKKSPFFVLAIHSKKGAGSSLRSLQPNCLALRRLTGGAGHYLPIFTMV